jgi:hypothetical protein
LDEAILFCVTGDRQATLVKRLVVKARRRDDDDEKKEERHRCRRDDETSCYYWRIFGAMRMPHWRGTVRGMHSSP